MRSASNDRLRESNEVCTLRARSALARARLRQNELLNLTTFVTGIVIRCSSADCVWNARDRDDFKRNHFSIRERNRFPISLREALYVSDLIHFLHVYVSLFPFHLNSGVMIKEISSEMRADIIIVWIDRDIEKMYCTEKMYRVSFGFYFARHETITWRGTIKADGEYDQWRVI